MPHRSAFAVGLQARATFADLGITYAALYLTGLGSASWFTAWLWGRLGAETDSQGFDDEGSAASVEPEPELVQV